MTPTAHPADHRDRPTPGVPRPAGAADAVPGFDRRRAARRRLSRAVSAVLTTALVVTNLIGAAVVLAVIWLILRLPPIRDAGAVRQLNANLAGAYIVFAVVAGALGGRALLVSCRAGCAMTGPLTNRSSDSSSARRCSCFVSRSGCGWPPPWCSALLTRRFRCGWDWPWRPRSRSPE